MHVNKEAISLKLHILWSSALLALVVCFFPDNVVIENINQRCDELVSLALILYFGVKEHGHPLVL